MFLLPPFTIHHFASLGSTNDQLKTMLDAPEFTCVTADEQTAGRGRRDRTWHSVAGEGLYLSVLLQPEIAAEKIPLLSLMTAIAVAETIIQLAALSVDIKWPNDVLVNNHKVGGILIESTSTHHEPPRVIIGIGVNLNQQTFPAELAATATSLKIVTGKNFAVTIFRDRLLDRIAFWYEELRAQREHKILSRWQELSTYAFSKQVIIIFDHEEISGETAGLNKSGALRLKTATGKIITILAGEIKHLRQDS